MVAVIRDMIHSPSHHIPKVFLHIIEPQSQSREIALDLVPHATPSFHLVGELRPAFYFLVRPIGIVGGRGEAAVVTVRHGD